MASKSADDRDKLRVGGNGETLAMIYHKTLIYQLFNPLHFKQAPIVVFFTPCKGFGPTVRIVG
jgi:hypothetical protein